jgi:hypothetical protein
MNKSHPDNSQRRTLQISVGGHRAAALALLPLLFALSIIASACSNQSAATPPQGPPVAAFTPKDLLFEPTAVGSSSSPESISMANSGGSTLTISSIVITGTDAGDFSQTNNCGSSLASQASCTINVVFTPTANGNRTAEVSVSDNGSNSPQAVTLAAAGTGSTSGQNCVGSPTPQIPSDVTSQMSYVNSAAGVSVTQLTNNGCNRYYYFDVPAYSAISTQIYYRNFLNASGNDVLFANPDGNNATILSSSTGNQAFVSPDGTFVYYNKPVPNGNPGGSDIYGGFLKANNTYTELRLTNLDVAPTPPLAVWEISASVADSSGGQFIAFSPDTLFHEVHVKSDGTAQLASNSTFDDPESSATFHRLRLNPKFPNIVMYKRNGAGGATPELWLVDLNTCTNNTCSPSTIVNVVANLPTPSGVTPKAGHIIWSPDGLDIAFSEPDIADFWIARNVVTAGGTLNLTGGAIPASQLVQLGPIPPQTGGQQMTADYCAFPPDWPTGTLMACLSGPASPLNKETVYLMSTDGLGTTKLLSSTDAPVLTINGTPIPEFAQDDTHILFNSDRPFGAVTGAVQIYMVSGFTYAVP